MSGVIRSLFLCSLGTYLLPGTTAAYQTAMVCFQDSFRRVTTLSCHANSYISITRIEVAFTIGSCSRSINALCPFHRLNSSYTYYKYILDECNNKSSCQLSSVAVRSREYKREFHTCEGLLQDRNSVRVEYVCRGQDSTITPPPIPVSPISNSILSLTTIKAGVAYSSTRLPTTAEYSTSREDNSTLKVTVEKLPTSMEGNIMERRNTATLGIALGSAFGAMAILVSIGLAAILVIRKRRRKHTDTPPYIVNSGDSLTDEFAYYSTPVVGTTADSRYHGNKSLTADSTSSSEYGLRASGSGYALLSSPEKEKRAIYVNIDNHQLSPLDQLKTNDIYDQCELSAPCPCVNQKFSDEELKADDVVDFEINELYSVSSGDRDDFM